VAERGNPGGSIENVSARTAGVQDRAAELQRRAGAVVRVVDTTAITSGRVAAESAVAYGHVGATAVCGHIGDNAAIVVGRVAANSAIAYGYYRAGPLSVPIGDAATPAGRVAAQGAVGDRHRCAAAAGRVGDPAAGVARRVAGR